MFCRGFYELGFHKGDVAFEITKPVFCLGVLQVRSGDAAHGMGRWLGTPGAVGMVLGCRQGPRELLCLPVPLTMPVSREIEMKENFLSKL